MNWNTVVGAKGRAKIEINRFTGKDGEARTNNQIKTFYAAEESIVQPSQHQAPFPTAGQTGGFVPGQF